MEDEMHRKCSMRKVRNLSKNPSEKLKHRLHHSTDLDGDGRMILKWNLGKHGECMIWIHLARNGVTTTHLVPPSTLADY
jgi:hypothetical protein